MRFTRLSAPAHGPFTGETLTPAPGLTVVWGLNEAGKSSWHSAAYLAITGLSRKRGRATKEEQLIIERRRPRTGDLWRLEADLVLDDGETLSVNWDLNQRVAKVLDSLGRDRANAWFSDGAPDLARIVGLDRASFLATACVRQSDLQRVQDDAHLLQDLLQKATTSADADSTASAAISIIEQFRKDQIGLERESSTRPLMEAKRRVETTSQALIAAQKAHQDRLHLLSQLTDGRTRLSERRDELQVFQTARSVAEARHQHRELVQRLSERDTLAERVQLLASQIERLDHREQVLLAARLHAQRLEVVRNIERQVSETATARQAAADAERNHHELRGQLTWLQFEQARRTAHSSKQRFARASELQHRHPLAPAHPADHDQVGRSVAAGPARATASTPLAIAAIATAIIGLILGIVIHPALFVLTVAGIVAAMITLRHRFGQPDHTDSEFQERLDRAELTNLLGGATVEDLGLEADQDQRLWQEQASVVRGLDPGAEALEAVDNRTLKERIHHLTGLTADASHQAAKLHNQIPGNDPNLMLTSARVNTDEALSRLQQLDRDAAERLAACSITDVDAQLSTCRSEREQRRQTRDQSAGQLRQLSATSSDGLAPSSGDQPGPSGDQSTPVVESDPVNHSAHRVIELEDAFSALPAQATVGFTLATLPSAEALSSLIDKATAEVERLHHQVAGLEGRLQERDAPGAAADPAAAVENHEAAIRELARVRELAEVLDETQSLLATAEDRVHRDIAPRLNASTNRWLPRIFGDRYTKVLIDPATLDVQVFAAGDVHRADLLSQGTTEQFYLLLRIALTESLTEPSGESCPLLLDDITVNFDRERKIAVLDLLREVATERQVLLFTMEDDVLEWARANLSGTDTLIELPGRVTA
ncbi:MAG: AAA family ATPase [Aquihabitans sp.]